jgi:hypothetical protein
VDRCFATPGSRSKRNLTTIEHRGRCDGSRGGLVWGFKPRIRRIFTNSALPRDCCSGVSMSARGSSDSAVIDSRYKPAWERECLSRSRRSCSPLLRSGALFADDSPCWSYSCSFVLFVVQNSTDKGHGVHGERKKGIMRDAVLL